MEFVNAEILARGPLQGDLKLLLGPRRMVFALLNVQHAELEASGKGVPGYIKPVTRTIELRLTEGFSSERIRDILSAMKDDPRLLEIRAFRVLYGREDLGTLCEMRPGIS